MQQWSGNILGSLKNMLKLLTNINIGLGIPQVLLLIKHRVIIKLPVKERVFSPILFFFVLRLSIKYSLLSQKTTLRCI